MGNTPTSAFQSTRQAPQHPINPPKFGVLAEALSGAVGFVDGSELTRLMFTDVVGMVAPRTALEYNKRGIDAGRETFIREIMGTLTNVYVVGWTGLLASTLFSNNVGSRLFNLNSKGIYTNAYINDKSMEALIQLAKTSVQQSQGQSAESVRNAFIQNFVSRLQVADSEPRNAVVNLVDHLRSQGKEVPEPLAALRDRLAQTHNLSPVDDLLQGQVQAKKELLTGTLANLYHEHAGKIRVLLPNGQFENRLIADVVEEHLQQALKDGLSHDPKSLSHFRIQEYRTLSKEARKQFNHVIGQMLEVAERAGLSEQVQLAGLQQGDRALLGTRSLKSLLEEGYNFIEQYLERSLTFERSLGESVGASTAKRAQALTDEAGYAILEKLAGAPKETGLLGKLIPRMADSLVAYTRKTKNFIVLGSMIFTIIAGMTVAWLNKKYTEWKHGGQKFFPGEGGPPVPAHNHPTHQQDMAALQTKSASSIPEPSLSLTGPPPQLNAVRIGNAGTIFQTFSQRQFPNGVPSTGGNPS